MSSPLTSKDMGDFARELLTYLLTYQNDAHLQVTLFNDKN